MDKNLLQISTSWWWLIVILLASVAIAYVLYVKKEVPWNRTQNSVLWTIRSIAIACILFLLLDPSFRHIKNTVQKPVIAILIDDSQSITGRGADPVSIKNRLQSLEASIRELNLETHIYAFSENDTLTFDHRTSPVSQLLEKPYNDLDGENLVAGILLSDGIYNRGISPVYREYLTPVFTVGMGDTIPPKDIGISRVRYNKVTFKGNQTPIQLELSQEGFDNKGIKISITEKGKMIASETITLTKDVQEVEFLVDTPDEGLRHLSATISSMEGESTNENNRSDIFLEVIDGRQKILIVASAPHPDIKAIRSALEETDNYSTEVYIPSISKDKPEGIYDVVIYHGAFSGRINYEPKENPGIWYILSSESSITTVNKSLNYLAIDRKGGQPDKVSGSFNQNFSKFKIDNTEIFESYPPIDVPFGDYIISGPAEVLMYQKLGSITTKKPLMVVYDDGSTKSATLVGQNIWQWKLQEAAIHDNSTNFQHFITKTIQYLSVKNDKKQFRVDTRTNTFPDTAPILFDTEVYNDIYERIYGNTIRLAITNEDGDNKNYSFTDSEINSTFKAPSLPAGIYSFSAQVKIGEKAFTDKGEFLVENINPEFLDLTADHRLLKNLAGKTGGDYVHYSQIDDLPALLEQRNFQSLIKSKEEVNPLIKSWWWFLIIFLLFGVEWGLRRYWGGY